MKNRLKYGLNSLIITAAVIAAILIINAIVSVIGSKANLKIDMTHDRVYEMSDWTKEAVRGVDRDVTIYALYPQSVSGDNAYAVRRYLENYARLNSKIHIEYIDPYTNPAFAQKYTSRGESVSEGTIIAECGDKYRIVPFDKQFERGVLKDEETTNLYLSMESSVTNAVLYVTSAGAGQTIYFTEGHSETSAYFPEALKNDGRSVDKLDLSGGIPEDAAMVIISCPERDISEAELGVIDEYMKNGGRLMYVTSAGMSANENLNGYMAEWGIDVHNDCIAEEDSDYLLSIHNDTVELAGMESHDITDNLIAQKLKLIAPFSSSLDIKGTNKHNAVQTALLKSSVKSWSAELKNGSLDKDTAVQGPRSIAVLSETLDENKAKVFVLSSLFALESGVNGQPILTQSSYANRDFILNTISYMCDEQNGTYLRSKDISTNLLSVTESQKRVCRIFLMYLLPIAIIAAGIAVWRKRKYK